MLALIIMVNLMEDNYLIHYGIPRRSGRYPYGSGDRPFQRVERIQNKAERYKEEARNASGNEKIKLENKAKKYEIKARKQLDKYDRKYAKKYAKGLNKSKAIYDRNFDLGANDLEKLAGERKLFSGKTVADLAAMASTRIAYQNLRDKAVSEIPSNTNYALELVNGKYRVRSKDDASSVVGVKYKPTGSKEYSVKSARGRVDLASTIAKSGLDVWDSTKVNKNYSKAESAREVSAAKAKADSRIAKAEAKAITIEAKAKAKSIVNNSKGVNQSANTKKVVKKSVAIASAALPLIAGMTKAVGSIRDSGESDKKVDKFITGFNKTMVFAIPTAKLGDVVMKNI